MLIPHCGASSAVVLIVTDPLSLNSLYGVIDQEMDLKSNKMHKFSVFQK
jgi:hypothetical protein